MKQLILFVSKYVRLVSLLVSKHCHLVSLLVSKLLNSKIVGIETVSKHHNYDPYTLCTAHP